VSYAIHDCSDDVNITIDERGAVLRKVLPSSGLPLSIALPKRVFKVVAARAIDHGDGDVTGDMDYVLLVAVRNLEEYNAFIEQLMGEQQAL
ncbi:DUF6101 family protein, partial [Rhizobium ruizarguesonis]